MTDEYLVRRIIEVTDERNELDFDEIQQTIAVVEAPEHWTVDQLVEAAYEEANMSPHDDPHVVSKLEGRVEVDPEVVA